MSLSSTAQLQATEKPAGAENANLGEGLWSDVWRRFKHNPIALAGFYVVCLLVFMALFADFIANDKPYYLDYKGKSYFPILRSYLVTVKLGQWPAELLNVDFKKLLPL